MDAFGRANDFKRIFNECLIGIGFCFPFFMGQMWEVLGLFRKLVEGPFEWISMCGAEADFTYEACNAAISIKP
jgi:hypothetical protein